MRPFRNFSAHDLLDNDWYKFTMQFAMFSNGGLSDTNVSFKFKDRKGAVKAFLTSHPSVSLDQVKQELAVILNTYAALQFDERDVDFVIQELSKAVVSGKDTQLDSYKSRLMAAKRSVRIDLTLTKEDGLGLEYSGTWFDTILFEVPFLAIISEYFNNYQPPPSDESIRESIRDKMAQYKQSNAQVIEFGTRRRFSRHVHEIVFDTIVQEAGTGALTSNVLLSKQHNSSPKGTCAHEWFMFYEAAQRTSNLQVTRASIITSLQKSLQDWLSVYTSIFALTDVFRTGTFFEAYALLSSELQARVQFRCDSGNELDYCRWIQDGFEKVYGKTLPEHALKKSIMFSNSLSPKKVAEIQAWHAANAAKSGETQFSFMYGVGTNFTNDLQYDTLDIVIKIHRVEDKFAFKLSDVGSKFVGAEELKAPVHTAFAEVV
ncbi:hypothetical protein HDU81_007589 [Chytriomyces hyalinus]|nr:hypothetical protein HDU81_007589 [Chytriomyces hyalinus]